MCIHTLCLSLFSGSGGRGFDLWSGHIKTLKMVLMASLLGFKVCGFFAGVRMKGLVEQVTYHGNDVI